MDELVDKVLIAMGNDEMHMEWTELDAWLKKQSECDEKFHGHADAIYKVVGNIYKEAYKIHQAYLNDIMQDMEGSMNREIEKMPRCRPEDNTYFETVIMKVKKMKLSGREDDEGNHEEVPTLFSQAISDVWIQLKEN